MKKLLLLIVVTICVITVGIISFPSANEEVSLGKSLTLIEKLENKTAKEKATIKGLEIAKIAKGKKTRSKYEIEITDTKAIEGGVEIFARVSENGKQIGFGRDGTIDIERFVFVNPPIMVDDPSGAIVRKWNDSRTGERKQRKLKEDPDEAILRALEHVIFVKQQKFDDTKIVQGKVGNTTTTVYPSVDGRTYYRSGGGGSGVNWATYQAAGGTAGQVSDSLTSDRLSILEADSGTDDWRVLGRGHFAFDTSGIDDTDDIDSAVMSLYGTTKTQLFTEAPSLNLYSTTGVFTTSLVNTDHELAGATAYSTAISYASFSTSGYNDYTFNSAGLADISKTGYTRMVTRDVADATNVEPTWGASGYNQFLAYMSDEAGTDKDPVLVIEHSEVVTGASGGSIMLMGM